MIRLYLANALLGMGHITRYDICLVLLRVVLELLLLLILLLNRIGTFDPHLV